MADSNKPTPESDEAAAERAPDVTPQGPELAREDLPDPAGEVKVAPGETEAEELLDAVEVVDETPDSGDPEDVVIDDADQLSEATTAARRARSAKPVKRNLTVAPVKKSKPTPRQSEARVVERKRTTPAMFVRQSVGELKKVVWPTAGTLRQYFIVVLVFVTFIMFFVAGLDALFGWLMLLWLS
ncbi:MAG: preprotein translocase subunit SecE [Brooklawnia sp.]